MYEWLAVILAGAAGGLAGTLLPSGHDTPVPGLISAVLSGGRGRQLVFHGIRNTLFGAIGSFVVWGGFGGEATFGSTDPSVNAVAVAVVIGLGGVATVNALVREQRKKERLETAMKRLPNLITEPEDGGDGP